MKDNLPNKPSELILLALKDLESVEKNPFYKIDMHRYHELHSLRCHVCLAGVVMVKELNTNWYNSLSPIHFENSDIKYKLYSLNYFRLGNIRQGFLFFYNFNLLLPEYIVDFTEVVPYSTDKKAFKSDMTRIADMLSNAGY